MAAVLSDEEKRDQYAKDFCAGYNLTAEGRASPLTTAQLEAYDFSGSSRDYTKGFINVFLGYIRTLFEAEVAKLALLGPETPADNAIMYSDVESKALIERASSVRSAYKNVNDFSLTAVTLLLGELKRFEKSFCHAALIPIVGTLRASKIHGGHYQAKVQMLSVLLKGENPPEGHIMLQVAYHRVKVKQYRVPFTASSLMKVC